MPPASMLISLTLLTFYVVITKGFWHECPENWIKCRNGRCIASMWHCDEIDDCGDMTDEENCEYPSMHIKCSDDDVQCPTNGRCIPLKWYCDGEIDCDDGFDEKDCKNVSSCDGFPCSNHHCIPSRWKCDGNLDCADGSDELSCSYERITTCDEYEFTCATGFCVWENKTCDGVKDCVDGSDEGSHCDDSCQNMTCGQLCRRSPSGAECYCRSGFELSQNNITCTDIDECLEDGICSQKCENLDGSYKCSCLPGYDLVGNQTCRASGDDPVLVFATTSHIRAMYLRSKVYSPVHDSIAKSIAVDVDPKDARVYWTDMAQMGSVFSSNLDGSGFKAIITDGLLIPEDIVVDYIARNLYITDSGLKQVLVCRIDGSICHDLHKDNVDKPRALALDIPESLLYWSDWGKEAGIHRSYMDGSHRRVFVSRDVIWPNGITIDHTTNRLYWCDAKIYRIEYISLDGKTRKVLIEDRVFRPFSLTVFEDTLYWTDWSTFSLESCNKFTGHNQTLVIRENKQHIMGVHVYHPVLSKDSLNPCWMSTCSHICAISSMGKHKCLCPPGFKLLADTMTCSIDVDSPQLFITEGSNIFHMHPEAVGNEVVKKIPITQVQNIGDLAFNWKSKTMFISDTQRREIMQIDIHSMNKTTLVQRHIESVEGLSYDWSGDNLFWLDSVKGTVEVLSLSTLARAIIVSELIRPLSIALAPEEGLMFVSVVGGQHPHVVMFQMDGSDERELGSVTGLPVSLCLHPKQPRLYWTDPKTETISSVNYLNRTLSRIVHKRKVPHVTSVAVSEKFLYWVNSANNKLKFVQSNASTASGYKIIVHSRPLPGNVTGSVIRKVKYIHALGKAQSTACSHNNGGCSEICLTKPSGRTCTCSIGKTLGRDKESCELYARCSANEFKCRTSVACFPDTYRCDGTPDCDDGSDEEKCEPFLRCPDTDIQCRNGKCILASWKCDSKNDCGDGSDEEECPELEKLEKTCSDKKFMCTSGYCIPELWRCDGDKDCVDDNSDEENCQNLECKTNEFRCDHGQCIPNAWVCDGYNDCFDSTDERKEKCGIKSQHCRGTEFRCKNGLCIDKAFVCDHRNDCEDDSDEANCVYNQTCREGMVKCKDETCIYQHEICDGHDDCDNDEVNCSAKTECSASEFLCLHDMRCIPRKWLCDRQEDCGDGSDEKLNSCHYKSTSPPPPPKGFTCDQFKCGSGECISFTKVCNGPTDCFDYSDEGALCQTACKRGNGGCTHLCSPSPAGPRCSCLPGYKLLSDRKTCDDENECEIPGMCSQFCNNSKGGFKCLCSEGYFLAHDHRKCKADGGPATLVYLLPDQIRALDLSSQSQRLFMQGDRTDMRGMDYDAAEGVFFWSEWREGTLNKFNIGAKRNDIIVHDVKRPYYVKWDWIAKNVYYTNGEASIMACSRTGEYCTVVIETIAKTINSFDLAPVHGMMFWSVWNEVREAGPGLIERSNMDGSGRIVILSNKIYWPQSVTVDNVLETIYWTDIKLQMMESADFHGLNRKVVVRDGMYYPFSMTVFEDYVYWADWGTDAIFRCNKFDVTDCIQLHKGDVKAEIMVVVHKVKQPQTYNRCSNSRCPQMCLQKLHGFSCRCDKRYDSRNGTCVQKIENHQVKKSKFLVQKCDEEYCKNGGKCVLNDRKRTCNCLDTYTGERCGIRRELIKLEQSSSHHDYSWVVAVLLGVFAVAAIILVILICRQNRNKLSKLSDSVAVSFRNPRYLFRKRGLVVDTDDVVETTDDLMLGKKGAYTKSGFGNPMFNQRPYMDPSPEDGDYKRWPSYDSDDSAFVSEYHCREDSNLTLDQTSMSSKERIIQFFKRI